MKNRQLTPFRLQVSGFSFVPFYRILLGRSELRYSVDILNHGFLSELNKEFPSLSIADLNFITLMVCKFSMVEIMICMGYTNERSAFNKRLEIAKKIGVHKESLIDYILNKIENLELEKHQD